MKSLKLHQKFIAFLLLLASVVSVVQGIANALAPGRSQDTQWSASRYLLHRTDPFDLYLNHGGSENFILVQKPNYPAPGLVFMWPYAAFDWPLARCLWLTTNLALSALVLVLVFRLSPRPLSVFSRILIATLFLMGIGWRVTIGNGQHGLFSLGLFLLAVYLHEKGRPGGWLPLAASWLKYSISVPLSLFFAWERKGFRTLFGAAFLNAALLVFCAKWTGSSVIDVLVGPLKVAKTATDQHTGAIDVFVIADHLGIAGQALPALASVTILVVSFLAIRKDKDRLSRLSTLTLTSLIVVFHQGYDFVILVLPLAYALSIPKQTPRTVAYLVATTFGWFIDAGLIALARRMPLTAANTLDGARFWFDIALFYGALFLSWQESFRSVEAGSPASERAQALTQAI